MKQEALERRLEVHAQPFRKSQCVIVQGFAECQEWKINKPTDGDAVRLSVLAGRIHANTGRPRKAKNLGWKIANVLLCRTVLNNDWEERSQMRNKKQLLQRSEKTETWQSETELSCADSLQKSVLAALPAVHLGWSAQPRTWLQGPWHNLPRELGGLEN